MNVRQFAEDCGASYEIERCLTYYPLKVEAVWSVPVEYSERFVSSAGYAHQSRGITLNPRIRSIRNEPKETFLHEVAHMIQWLAYGHIDHGYTFHEVMHRLAQVPQRCHAYNLKPTLNAGVKLEDTDL